MPFADPDKRREYDRDHKRKARVAEPCPTRLTLPVEFRAKTAADVLGLLNEQLDTVRQNTVRQDASLGSVERAKAIGSLAGIALRAIDAGDVAARVEALESILKSRPKERAVGDGGPHRFFGGSAVRCFGEESHIFHGDANFFSV